MSLGQAFVDVRGDVTGFTQDLKRKLKEALKGVEAKVKIIIEPAGIPAFRKAITDSTKDIKVKVAIEPLGIAAFRSSIQDATKNVKAKIYIEHVGIVAFRQGITDATKAVPVKVYVLPTGLAAFRAAITAATAAAAARVNIGPNTSGLGSVGPAARAAANTLEQAFGRGARFVEDELRQMAASGNLSISDIQAVSERAARAIIVSMGNAAHLTQAEYRQMAADIAASIRGAAALGNRDFDSLAAAATAAANRIRASFAGVGSPPPFAPLVGQASSAADSIASVFQKATDIVKSSLIGVVSGFGDVIKRVIQLDAAVGAFGIKGTLDLEKLEASLSGVIAANNNLDLNKPKDLAKAYELVNEQIKNLQKFNRFAPQFSFRGLTEASSTLQTLGINGDQALGVVQTLTNALAAAGRASDANLQGAIVPLLQAASTGKFLGQDLNQLAQRLPGVFSRGKVLESLKGIIDAERIARGETKLTADGFQKLRESGLPAAETINAVLKQLGESKVAKGALARQLNTVSGQFFAIRRSIEQGVLDLFKSTREPLRKALQGIAPDVEKIFSPDGPLLSSIRDFVLVAVPLLGQLIGPITRFISVVNTTLLAAFRAIGPEIGPLAEKFAALTENIGPKLVDTIPKVLDFVKQLITNLVPAVEPIGKIVAALGILAGLSLGPITSAIGQIGTVIGPIADILLSIAGTLAAIVQTDAGRELVRIAGAMVAISLAVKAVTVLRGAALAIAGLGATAGGAGAAGGLALLAARFRPFLIGGAILFGLDEITKKMEHLTGVSGGLAGTIKSGLENIKGFGGDIFDATVNGAQAAADGITAAINTIPGVNIDTTEFNKNMDAASAHVIGLHERLGGLPRQIHTDYTLTINTQFTSGGQHETGSAQTLANEFNLEKPGVQRALDLQKVKKQAEVSAADLGKQVEDAINKALGNIANTGSTSGGGGGGSSKTKSAAKAVAARFIAAIKQILDSLDRDFKSGLIKDKADQIEKTLRGLAKNIIDAFDAAGKARPSRLLKTIADENKALQKLAIERDVVADKLKAATDKMVQIRDAVRSFANVTSLDFAKAVNNIVTLDIAGSFRVLSKTTDATKDAIKHSATEIAAALKDRLKSIQAFQADIDVLIKKGVRRSLIDEIIGAGVEGGGATADALAHASSATIAGINKTQDAINAAATKLGNTAAENFFRSGGQIVEGLIAGLKDRKSEIAKEMTDIANSLITAIRKTLKIHSPSKVMRSLFNHAGHGAVLGLRDMVPHMLKQSAAFAKAGLPDMAGLQQVHANLTDRRSAGLSEATALRLVSGLEGARPNKEVHAPITQHFHQPPTPQVARNLFATVGRR